MVENRRPHGDATARRSAGQMASQRKSVLAGNRKKQKRAQKRRAKQHAAPAFPANATQPSAVPPSTHEPPTTHEFYERPSTHEPPFTHEFYERLLRACSAGRRQALAKRDNVYDNGTPATVIDTLSSPSCSPCASTENGFEQSSFPLRRTNHFTKENDSIDDKALDAVPATETHNAILDTRNVTHTATTDDDNAAAHNNAHATFTADELRALTRRELQALAKRFKVKANAKSSFIIDQLTSLSSSPCQNTETEFEQFLPLIRRTNYSANEADKDDHKENNAATMTAKNANATMGVPHIASTTAAARQALAMRDDVNVKAKSANVTGTVNPPCSPCNSTETEFEQSLFPFRRTDHSTENDNTDDQACNATTAADTQYATLDVRNVTHIATNTAAKQPRVKRGSHPAARRQRKRIAAARAAAAASGSPPRQEETSSPCDSTETTFEQFLPLFSRTDHSDHYQTDATHTVRQGV